MVVLVVCISYLCLKHPGEICNVLSLGWTNAVPSGDQTILTAIMFLIHSLLLFPLSQLFFSFFSCYLKKYILVKIDLKNGCKLHFFLALCIPSNDLHLLLKTCVVNGKTKVKWHFLCQAQKDRVNFLYIK